MHHLVDDLYIQFFFSLQQQARSVLNQKQPAQPSQIQAQTPPNAPTIIRRVQNPDGTISIIRTTMATPPQPGSVAGSKPGMVPTVVNSSPAAGA